MIMCDLEKYPHIIKNITLFWGTKRCRDYLESLLLIESDRNRAGFQPGALFEILFLIKLHDNVFPSFASKNNPWFTYASRR